MKKYLFLLFVLIPGLALALEKGEGQPVPKMNFYGVDFTLVKTFGVKEELVTETKKYPYGNFFAKYVREIDQSAELKKIQFSAFDNVNIDEAIYRARIMNEAGMPTYNKAFKIDDDALVALIKSFNTGKDTGYGVIYVAELLNKEDGIGNFIAVCFNVRTKRIVFADRVSAKAGGFGLRNYWASPLEKFFKL
ncbi:MAG: hypothetical protein CVT93_03935 [Bacteroidetes bacterium HGW-Bacteroidetes-10]|nr:MAG: hypothetical protein CVT93_03935 [Bacteroidetes bacterium HGW-Bacteroidetes-10]